MVEDNMEVIPQEREPLTKVFNQGRQKSIQRMYSVIKQQRKTELNVLIVDDSAINIFALKS